MGQVAVRINGRQYQVACDDGQEDRLSELAVQLDRRVQDLMAAVGSEAGEQRLLVMAALLAVDELSEARAEVNRLHEQTGLAAALDLMAARIEAVADRLEAG